MLSFSPHITTYLGGRVLGSTRFLDHLSRWLSSLLMFVYGTFCFSCLCFKIDGGDGWPKDSWITITACLLVVDLYDESLFVLFFSAGLV